MNRITLQVENLKCHGCASTIKKGLTKFDEVENVTVDVKKSSVDIYFNGREEHTKAYKTKLARLGYPETGNNNAVSVVKSYVSCAVGRIVE